MPTQSTFQLRNCKIFYHVKILDNPLHTFQLRIFDPSVGDSPGEVMKIRAKHRRIDPTLVVARESSALALGR